MDENVFLNEEKSEVESTLLLATIGSASSSAGTATIKFDGESETSAKAYKVLRSAWPLSAGDRVVIMKQSGTYVIIGKIGNAAALPISLGGSGQTGASKTTTIAQIATAGTNMNITGATFYQWGKLAMLAIDGKATDAISGGSTIFTVVSGKRPALNSSAQVWLSTSNTAVVKINGEITLAGSGLSSGGAVTILACYLLP